MFVAIVDNFGVEKVLSECPTMGQVAYDIIAYPSDKEAVNIRYEIKISSQTRNYLKQEKGE